MIEGNSLFAVSTNFSAKGNAENDFRVPSDIGLEDNSGRGRPSDFNEKALLTVIEQDESMQLKWWPKTLRWANPRSFVV